MFQVVKITTVEIIQKTLKLPQLNNYSSDCKTFSIPKLSALKLNDVLSQKQSEEALLASNWFLARVITVAKCAAISSSRRVQNSR